MEPGIKRAPARIRAEEKDRHAQAADARMDEMIRGEGHVLGVGEGN